MRNESVKAGYHYPHNDHHVALLARIFLILSLYNHPYHPSLQANPQDYILCLHRVVVGNFLSANTGTSM